LNYMSLMIMKITITSTIRESISENDVEGNYVTAKEYLVFIEKQFKSTFKS
jgi:hypothetical protein